MFPTISAKIRSQLPFADSDCPGTKTVSRSGPGKQRRKTLSAAARFYKGAGGRLILKCWDDAVEQWIIRNRLRNGVLKWFARTEMRSPRHVSTNLPRRSIQGHQGKRSGHWWCVTPHQHTLEKHAPERVTLPHDARPRSRYSAGKSPMVSATIQDYTT